jgi:hypothetical protein
MCLSVPEELEIRLAALEALVGDMGARRRKTKLNLRPSVLTARRRHLSRD